MTNADRLKSISADTIVAGLNLKWTNAYSFLNMAFAASTSTGSTTFNSLIGTQFGLDIAYYLEPATIFFLLVQTKDKNIYVTNGTYTLYLSESNLIQMLIHKWKKGITQTTAIISSISVGENFTWTFISTNTGEDLEIDRYIINVILNNYLESYFTLVQTTATAPNITQTHLIVYDALRERFNTVYETSF